ncbi:MAG: VCBS repeat-containing protein, partial [Acidobacteria bacterium]|nr:VCBS repeat-containing protein [Acidobacteriota bacterium]
MFVGNESEEGTAYPGNLFRNNRDGTFTDVAFEAGVAVVGFVKGAVWGDYDNDGRLDLYVTLLRADQPNRLFHNEGRGPDGTWSFRDVAAEAGVQGPAVSFPTWFFDYDNDGWQDLFVSGFSGGLADVVLER